LAAHPLETSTAASETIRVFAAKVNFRRLRGKFGLQVVDKQCSELLMCFILVAVDWDCGNFYRMRVNQRESMVAFSCVTGVLPA
jgi:hypothetical protein